MLWKAVAHRFPFWLLPVSRAATQVVQGCIGRAVPTMPSAARGAWLWYNLVHKQQSMLQVLCAAQRSHIYICCSQWLSYTG